MSRKWKYVGLVYLACALVTEALLIYGAYDSGVFQRQHTGSDWVIVIAIYLGIAAIWPYAVAVFLLLYFGILPE
jgi:hypothetical protein